MGGVVLTDREDNIGKMNLLLNHVLQNNAGER